MNEVVVLLLFLASVDGSRIVLPDDIYLNKSTCAYNSMKSLIDCSQQNLSFFPMFNVNNITLKSLNISRNKLVIHSSVYFLQTFKVLKPLEILDLKSNRLHGASEIDYPDDIFSHLISLRELRVDGLESGYFGKGFSNLANLKILDLSGLTGKCFIPKLTDRSFMFLPFIEHLDISACGIHHIAARTFEHLKSLRYLDVSLNMYLAMLSLPNITFGLQFSPIHTFKANYIQGPTTKGKTTLLVEYVINLRNTSLEEFWLDGNYLGNFGIGVLSALPLSLTQISLSNNSLSFDINCNVDSVNPDFICGENIELFQSQMNLSSLDLSYNKIVSLPKDSFKHLFNLKNLDLRSNPMTNFNVNISHLHKLKTLDLSNNQISYISSLIRKDLDSKEKLGVPDFSINLAGNPLECTCRSRHFLHWINNTNINFKDINRYSCKSSSGDIWYFSSLKEIIKNLESECVQHYNSGLVLGSGITFLITTAMALGYFRFRWFLKFKWYKFKVRIFGHKVKNKQLRNRKYKYDAFISYADDETVHKKAIEYIVHTLEKRGYHLFLQEECAPGRFVLEEVVVEATANSRVTLVFLTEEFLKSYVCMFGLHMAHLELQEMKNPDKIIQIVVFKDILDKKNIHKVDSLILYHIKCLQNYIECPDDTEKMELIIDEIENVIDSAKCPSSI